jgi:hypothetical protein
MAWARWIVTAGLLLTVPTLAPVAWAQEKGPEKQEEEEEKEHVCVEAGPWEAFVRVLPGEWDGPRLFWLDRRARLGVYVNTRANPETDSRGALITGVVPGSPADKAGLEKGDIITKLDGESLLKGAEVYDEDESAPGMRLIERARKLEPGDTVEIEYLRDGDRRTTKLVVGEFDEMRGLDLEHIRDLTERAREMSRAYVPRLRTLALEIEGRLGGLKLVALNPELGEYFGTDDGVLVVKAPEDNELKLRPGDVIKEIDGRTVKSPDHAVRILRSYEPDEDVTLEVVRKRKTITLKGRVAGSLRRDP